MRLTLLFVGLLFSLASISEESKEPKITISHAIAQHGTPKYGPDFTHWNYVNPEAPKGGYMTQGTLGSFDNFNRYAMRGDTPSGIGDFLTDRLMSENSDEEGVLYGLIAEKVEYPSSHDWVIIHLNPKATFQDGSPILASDVAFSFKKFTTEGIAQYKRYMAGITVEILDSRKVKFTLPESDRDKIVTLCNGVVLPEKYYKDKNLEEPFDEPPLGSGQYTVSDYKMGQYIEYKRNENYWASNHRNKKGLHNFNFIRYEYYLDETVLLEAFKKGEYDFRSEYSAKNWATAYTGTHFDSGNIIKKSIPHEIPGATSGYIFNVRRNIFQDRDVRKAISLLFDFEWTNKNIFYGTYARNTTYFRNTPYSATGLPSGLELELLNKYKDLVPKELFTEPFSLPVNSGDGNIRPRLREALTLLKKAGYGLKNGKMQHKETNKNLEFELLVYAPSSERIATPFKENLAKAGITMNIRLIDPTQFQNRAREHDYDMISTSLGGGSYPSSSLLTEWHSDYITSSYNHVGAKNRALNELIEGIIKYQLDDEKLRSYGKALDRFVLWNYYTVLQYHSAEHRISYWNKFAFPAKRPTYNLGSDSWWVDPQLEKKLPKRNARN